ncbi:serine/threonine-protein kinase Nek11 isoform X4 [Marmota monax]|uniref:serine/threonine-protein kinase Nek11 isoform X4 n=1 Tax=Marmota monax TaxID=9995 RepID=UPI001EB0A165|nr:serine/threonine-protein kinase Nek11 isoform X4 [Marmota monax]
MCCMDHAFTGSNFLSIVLKIVEGDTPSLPERYPRELNTIMESMLNKNPSLRPSALEILKNPYIAEQLQHLMCRYSEITLEDKNLDCQKEAARIINAMQKKIHLQTLRELSEVQKMTPRERMRLRKLQAADEKARKLKKIVEDKYEENNKRMQELRSRNFQQLSTNVLHELDEPASENLPESQPTPSLDFDSSREEAITDLEHNGMCLHQLSSECLAACSGPCQPLKEALIVCDHSLSACQHWAMTRLKNRLTKHFFPLYVLCNSEHSWKLTPGGGPSLNGLHAIIIDLTLKQCRTDSEVQFPSLIDCSPSPYKFILKK